MAIHTTTAIYGAAYDLLNVAIEAARSMPRDVKLIVGEPLVERCIEMTTHIRRANCASDKVGHIDRLLERNDEVEALLRVSVEQRYIARGLYGKAIQLSQSVGRQAGGWRKSSSFSSVARPPRQPGPNELQSGPAARPQGDRHAR
jgi:hypothetical protein